MHYMLYCMKKMGLFSCTLLERLSLMLMALVLLRNWCESPHIQHYQDLNSDFNAFSSSRFKKHFGCRPAACLLRSRSPPFPASTMFIFLSKPVIMLKSRILFLREVNC